MNKLFLFLFFLPLWNYALLSQSKDISVNWQCNAEIEILSGRLGAEDTLSVRGDFNNWARVDLTPDPGNAYTYINTSPTVIPQLSQGDTIFYKFFYTPSTWEDNPNKIYIITQNDYDNGTATISRYFNNTSLSTVTNQETVIQFTVDCNGAISHINNQPFPVVNTCHIAGGRAPLQWPSAGWPDSDLDLMVPMYDNGTDGGDLVAGDKVFSTLITFPIYTEYLISYKYSINFGDSGTNNGGNDNESGYDENHFIELSRYMISGTVQNTFGSVGNHDLINVIINPPIPAILFSTTSLDFGNTSVNVSSNKSLTVTNTGSADLVVNNITCSNTAFTASPTSFTLGPEENKDVTITFTPTEVTAYNGILTITHNAAGSPSQVSVSGNGVSAVTYPDNINVTTSYVFNDYTKTSSYRIIGLPGLHNKPIGDLIPGQYGKNSDWRAFSDPGSGESC